MMSNFTSHDMKDPYYIDKDDFVHTLARYEQLITSIENTQTQATEEQLLDVLLARDSLQALIESSQDATDSQDTAQPTTGSNVLSLSVIDHRLRSLGPTIASQVKLDTFRKTLNRPSNYWWWAFEEPQETGSRFDWAWNALTAGALALAASFMYNIYSAFIVGNADVATALSTIVQVAGLAVIAGVGTHFLGRGEWLRG
ncbi:hypothetical protein [Candidatus Entotheonella palauensis]|uniref:hypothetical protein n=1 Tax=Candidatus Entotheonella palauensis TaxID=93172 RepID=UPI000B7F9C31|nr:hypothetical protein [Candidatus Entotheonella palauensis]